MALRLVDDERGLSLELQLPPMMREAVGRQLERCLPPFQNSTYTARVSFAITNVLDNDLLPPSVAQLSYAKAIGKALGIEVPSDALHLRGQMMLFLDYYVPLFEQHKQGLDGKLSGEPKE